MNGFSRISTHGPKTVGDEGAVVPRTRSFGIDRAADGGFWLGFTNDAPGLLGFWLLLQVFTERRIDAHIARPRFGQLVDLVVDNNERFIVDVAANRPLSSSIRSKWPPPANGYPGTGKTQRSCALVNSQF
jgi:hypothetical protein